MIYVIGYIIAGLLLAAIEVRWGFPFKWAVDRAFNADINPLCKKNYGTKTFYAAAWFIAFAASLIFVLTAWFIAFADSLIFVLICVVKFLVRVVKFFLDGFRFIK